MLTAILIGFFAVSAFVSAILVAACVLSGRSQEKQACERVEIAPAIAEVKLPYRRRLRTSLSSQ
jgi:parvulin-like peptidyl-prolyl isomerase